jgi:hypothetical protein
MAIVVDVPMVRKERGAGVVEGFRCERLLPDGRVCGQPVMDARSHECLRHYQWEQFLMPMLQIPYPWDAACLHEILARTMAYVISKQLSLEQARAVALLVREMRYTLGAFERELW